MQKSNFELIDAFFEQKKIADSSKPSYKSRIRTGVLILERKGIFNPVEADFANILEPAIDGKKEQDRNQILSRTKDFYSWLKMKGDNTMSENTISNPENEGLTNNYTVNQDASNTGRPITTGRSEKISLYVTKETYKQLEALRIYDEISLQDLLNEFIQASLKTRTDDLEFLRGQEQARQERKAKKQ